VPPRLEYVDAQSVRGGLVAARTAHSASAVMKAPSTLKRS